MTHRRIQNLKLMDCRCGTSLLEEFVFCTIGDQSYELEARKLAINPRKLLKIEPEKPKMLNNYEKIAFILNFIPKHITIKLSFIQKYYKLCTLDTFIFLISILLFSSTLPFLRLIRISIIFFLYSFYVRSTAKQCLHKKELFLLRICTITIESVNMRHKLFKPIERI